MINSTPKKRGRPIAYFRTADDTRIRGLSRRADGRWKISKTGQTFVEPDERLAVAKFYELTSTRPSSNLGNLKVHPNAEEALIDICKRAVEAGGYLDATVETDGEGSWGVADEHLSSKQWGWLRKQIFDRPKWVAQKIGIEQIGWLTDMQRPTDSPKLADIIKLYAAKPHLRTEEETRYRRFWDEFTKAVGVMTVREITHEHVERYEQHIAGLDLAPKSIKHRYSTV